MKTIERTTEKKTNPIIKVGDKVRSYDFPTSKDCFVEGVVESIEGHPLSGTGEYLKFKVTRKVFGGKEIFDADSIGEYNWAPQNGLSQMLSDELTNGVELIQPSCTSDEDLKDKIILEDMLVKVYDIDSNGRARWSMYKNSCQVIRYAEGTINLVANFCHVDVKIGITRLFNVDTDCVDVEGVIVDIVENRWARMLV